MTRSCRGWGISVHWINRGGGCVLHLPGQLAAYLALPLEPLGHNLGRYLDGLHDAIIGVLAEFDLQGTTRPDVPGVFLGNARVASVGVAVDRWIAYHGLTLNVGPFMEPVRRPRRARAWLVAAPPDLDRGAPATTDPDAEGPRGADPSPRGRLRPGAAPRLHAPSPDPPEGPRRMSTLKVLGERPGLPILPVVPTGRHRIRTEPGPAAPRVAQAADPGGGGDVLHQGPDRRAGAGDDLRERAGARTARSAGPAGPRRS